MPIKGRYNNYKPKKVKKRVDYRFLEMHKEQGITQMREYLGLPAFKTKEIKRKCLKCDQTIKSVYPGICDKCKHGIRDVSDFGMYS